METDLKCNRLTCRTSLTDKAVVTTCSHIFCLDCANELFGTPQICPACESALTEPDDAVICTLHPSNDYKTSVLSGLSPSVILEISGRAIAFWQYQIHQENSFQAAILKNLNERNAHLQKQLDNVVREGKQYRSPREAPTNSLVANSELTLLNNKLTGVERDLEVERRKSRDLADSARERDKEYQKLKAQYDALKRKTILAPDTLATAANEAAHQLAMQRNISPAEQPQRLGDIVGGMDANRVQRTPLRQAQSNGFIQQPTRMGQQQPFRRSTSTASRAFNPHPNPMRHAPSASVSGSEIDEDGRLAPRRPSVFQSVAAGTYAKGRTAPRAQPTPARSGQGGFRPAGTGL